MFDAINLEQAVSDIYNAGVNDDNLILIYKANKEVKMAVNTPNGLSERQSIENVVLQGDTFGSILIYYEDIVTTTLTLSSSHLAV